MKFIVDNVGKVKKAEIDNLGITIIAGYNDTGKSTILKSVDAILKSYGNKIDNIRKERWNSVRMFIRKKEHLFDKAGFSFLPISLLEDLYRGLKDNVNSVDEISYDVFKSVYNEVMFSYKEEIDVFSQNPVIYTDQFIKEMHDGLDEIVDRTSEEYFTFLSTMNLRKEFGNQATNLINSKPSTISFESSNGKKGSITFECNKVSKCEGDDLSINNSIYLETRNILDSFDKTASNVEIRKCIHREAKVEVFEEFDEIEKNKDVIQKILKEVLHGRLRMEDDNLKYDDTQIGDSINLHNVASGMKTLLIIQRLIENGTLTENSWLLIDEPETNLHPEWHIQMAEILVLMKKKLGINILVSSHSPYFIRAMEVQLVKHDMKEFGSFYLMQPEDKQYNVVNVTKVTEKIYDQLYRPLADL